VAAPNSANMNPRISGKLTASPKLTNDVGTVGRLASAPWYRRTKLATAAWPVAPGRTLANTATDWLARQALWHLLLSGPAGHAACR